MSVSVLTQLGPTRREPRAGLGKGGTVVGRLTERGPRGWGLREGCPDSCLSGFHLRPRLPPLHFCLLEAAGLWGHCVGRLKGFEGPGELRGQRPGSAQSAQRGRGGRRARNRLGHSGRDQAWYSRPPAPSRPRHQVLQLCPLPRTCQGPGRQPPPHLGPGGPGPQLPSWCPSTQPNSWFKIWKSRPPAPFPSRT